MKRVLNGALSRSLTMNPWWTLYSKMVLSRTSALLEPLFLRVYHEHWSRMLVLSRPHSVGKQATCVFFTVCTTASRPGSCYSSEWLFFPVVCGNNGTRRPILHGDRGLLFLATAWAAQDISQSFGCLWSVEPRVHLGGIFQPLLLGIRCILKWFIHSIPLDL